jgi:hypothetical protein
MQAKHAMQAKRAMQAKHAMRTRVVRRVDREDEGMRAARPLTLLLIAGAIASSAALALYVLLWRANVAMRELALRAA